MKYSERLWAPALWWIVALLFGLSAVVALGAYLGDLAAVAATFITLALIVAVLVSYGRVEIAVDSQGLRAGDARLEWPYVGPARTLDPAAAGELLATPGAASAYLLVRPYVATAVQVQVLDPADPHPYWFLSTRRPAALLAALEAARPAADA